MAISQCFQELAKPCFINMDTECPLLCCLDVCISEGIFSLFLMAKYMDTSPQIQKHSVVYLTSIEYYKLLFFPLLNVLGDTG